MSQSGVGKTEFGSGQSDRVSGWSGWVKINPNETRISDPTRSDPNVIRITLGRVTNLGFIHVGLHSDRIGSGH